MVAYTKADKHQSFDNYLFILVEFSTFSVCKAQISCLVAGTNSLLAQCELRERIESPVYKPELQRVNCKVQAVTFCNCCNLPPQMEENKPENPSFRPYTKPSSLPIQLKTPHQITKRKKKNQQTPGKCKNNLECFSYVPPLNKKQTKNNKNIVLRRNKYEH